jgi:hypothetical protein
VQEKVAQVSLHAQVGGSAMAGSGASPSPLASGGTGEPVSARWCIRRLADRAAKISSFAPSLGVVVVSGGGCRSQLRWMAGLLTSPNIRSS